MQASTVQGSDASWRRWMWVGLAGLLLLPAVAMRFTAEVNWGLEDFAAAALLLGMMGGGVELASRMAVRPVWRMITGVAVVAAVALIWADAAVGIG